MNEVKDRPDAHFNGNHDNTIMISVENTFKMSPFAYQDKWACTTTSRDLIVWISFKIFLKFLFQKNT